MLHSHTEIINKINHFSVRNEAFFFIIDFSGENGFVITQDEADNIGILHNFYGGENHVNNLIKSSLKFDFIPVDILTYKNAFEKVAYHLQRGDTYLLNLTFPTPLQTNLSLSEIYHLSNAPFKLLVPGHFVVFSPEVFITVRDSMIFSHPMKGTIDGTIPGAEQKLLADEKELFEHNTIVDLIRNDLSMVSTNVKVSRFRYIDRIHTNRGDLLQASSEITGELPDGYQSRLGNILYTLLPAGSVTGAPKEKTVEIIREAETYDRGFYTGIFGFYDGKSLSSAVSIRFIEQTNDGLVFKSGGGITALSDMESEYLEMLKKIYVPVI
jgi:para-aminobenzoate synthetase component 1